MSVACVIVFLTAKKGLQMDDLSTDLYGDWFEAEEYSTDEEYEEWVDTDLFYDTEPPADDMWGF
jgi:hypothetical protein